MPVVEQPHAAHRLEAHERAEQGADQGHQRVEDGDRAGDDIRDHGHRERAAEPGAPVDPGVAGEVSGAAEEGQEDVFGGELCSSSKGGLVSCVGRGAGLEGSEHTWVTIVVVTIKPGRAMP